MRHILFICLGLSLCLVGCTPRSTRWHEIPLQIEVIAQGSNAAMSVFIPTHEGRREVLSTFGFVGKGGVGRDKKEGDGKSPVGVYDVEWAFGLAEDPGAGIPYAQVTERDVWVDDPASRYYNRWARADLPVKDWNSAEVLADEPVAYKYAVIVEYNTGNVVRGAGSAIFIHCSKGIPTTGCISIPEEDMRTLLLLLRPGTRIAIADSPETMRDITR